MAKVIIIILSLPFALLVVAGVCLLLSDLFEAFHDARVMRQIRKKHKGPVFAVHKKDFKERPKWD